MVEDSSLFNPYFLGSSFKWWVAQIPDDATWRENIEDKSHEGTDVQKGWGYRYKVRILGLHDKDEEIIPSDQLPWAQVMYPVTAGSGGAGAMQTPNIRQGQFVVGFWLDDQDMEYPMIMGVLGNNNQNTGSNRKKIGTTESNYAPTSGYAKGKKPDPTVKVSDDQLKVDARSFKEDTTDIHEIVAASTKRNNLYTGFTAPLSSPCPKDNTDMTSISITINNLVNIINQIQHAIASPIDAVSKYLKIDVKGAIDGASKLISGFVKNIIQRVRGFVTKLFSKAFSSIVSLLFPSDRGKLFGIKSLAFEKLASAFSKVIGKLPGIISGFLNKSFGKYEDNPKSENSMIAPMGNDPQSGSLDESGDEISQATIIFNNFNRIIGGSLENGTLIVDGSVTTSSRVFSTGDSGREFKANVQLEGNRITSGQLSGNNNSKDGIKVTGGFVVVRTNELITAPEVAERPLSERPNEKYENRKPTRKPLPICSTEALVGNVLGALIPEITNSTQEAVKSVDSFMVDYFGTVSTLPKGLDALSSAGIDPQIFVSPGDRRQSTLSNSLGVQSELTNQNTESRSPRTTSTTKVKDNVTSAKESVKNVADSIEQSISGKTTSIDPKILNASQSLLAGDIGGAAQNLIGGDIGQTIGQATGIVGDLASGNILGVASSLLPGNFGSVLGGAASIVGSIGGSLTEALGFVSAITNFFSFDEPPKCPQSNGYRLHDGSTGPGQNDIPNMNNVQKAAEEGPQAPTPIPVIPFAQPNQTGLYEPSTGQINDSYGGISNKGTPIPKQTTSGDDPYLQPQITEQQRQEAVNSLELY